MSNCAFRAISKDTKSSERDFRDMLYSMYKSEFCGGSYSYQAKEIKDYYLSKGITVKVLWGHRRDKDTGKRIPTVRIINE